MLIKIIDRFAANGSQFYEWTLADGPEGIETVHGYATDLITAFSKVLEWHERISADYAAEIAADMDTLNKFLQQDETSQSD
jgi:hypothetical protein